MDPIDDEEKDQFDVGGGSGTVKSPALPPTPAKPPVMPALPVAAPMATPTVAPKTQAPMPGIPPSVDQDELGKFLAGQKAGIEQYGPEKQLATEQALIRARTSPGMGLANAGAGLADALMQGVARAGNPGFQEKLQNQGNALAGEVGGAMEKARTGKMEELKAETELGQEDPASPLSKAAQASFGPVLMKMGVTQQQISKMPASIIGAVENGQITLTEALARIEETGAYQQGMLGVQEATLANKAHEFNLEHPVASFLSSKFGEGNKPVAGGPAPFTPDVVNYAKTHGITPEQAQAIKMRRGG